MSAAVHLDRESHGLPVSAERESDRETLSRLLAPSPFSELTSIPGFYRAAYLAETPPPPGTNNCMIRAARRRAASRRRSRYV